MANEMRDRLVELIKQADINCENVKHCDKCVGYGKGAECINYLIADHLIENGVIVPPVKVGDTVYELKENERIVKGIVQSIHQNLVGNEQGRWIVTSWFDDYYVLVKERNELKEFYEADDKDPDIHFFAMRSKLKEKGIDVEAIQEQVMKECGLK